MRCISEALPYLTDDQLVEAFKFACSFEKRSWLVQAAVLHEAQQRSTYGGRTLEAIARHFEISRRQAQKYALVWKVFFAESDGTGNANIDVFSLDQPSWYVFAATETQEPVNGWLTPRTGSKKISGTPSHPSDATSSKQGCTSRHPMPNRCNTSANTTCRSPPCCDGSALGSKTYCVPVGVEDYNDCK